MDFNAFIKSLQEIPLPALTFSGLPGELTILALATLLGLVQLLVAGRVNNGQRGLAWNLGARDAEPPPVSAVAGRLERASRNFMESFPFFVAAVLLAWSPGMEGGHAIADVLLGDAEPTGRLPMAIPHRQGDLPEVDWDATTVTYSRWWGQRKLDRDGVPAAYPLGFGLGYTTFSMTDLEVGELGGERFSATVTMANTGCRAGRHVVQFYALKTVDTGRRVHHLVGFRSVYLEPGTSRRVVVDCSIRPIQRWAADGFTLTAEDITVMAAAYAGDPAALEATLVRRRGPVSDDALAELEVGSGEVPADCE
jgi:hypothetical protein